MSVADLRRFAPLVVTWLVAAGLVHADERILSFDSHVAVQADGSLEVRETVRVNAEGRDIRRGIFREFPTIYPGRDGTQVVVGFAFVSAQRDGHDENWRAEPRGNGVRVYLGNPSVTLPHGEHTYEIVYRTDRQMGFFADHDELYWNATGNGWDFPIDRATATVSLPAAIPRDEIRLEGYTGPQGAKGQDYVARLEGGEPRFATTRGLAPREGLTIVAMWPKGYITPAVERDSTEFAPAPIPGTNYVSGTQVAPARYRAPLFIAVLGLMALVGYYWYVWNKVGRDPPQKVTIPHYESPAGQSPAAMRYLLEMSYDDKCLGAAVLSLAVKGHLRIEEDSGFLGFKKTFTLVRVDALAGGRPPLSGDEQALLSRLFASGDRLVLEQENHEEVSDARLAHRRALKDSYTRNFFRVNGGWHLLGIVLSILIAVLALSRPGTTENWPEWYFSTGTGRFTLLFLVLALIVNGVFGKLLKAPTIAGQAVMDQIRGFRMYLDVAEGEGLKRIEGPPLTPQLFESYLPAALALGVEQNWAERFARVFDLQAPNYQPAWYVGNSWNPASIAGFSSQLGATLSSAISSAATAPGSSSGGGGGGSSGGGGGGGGGGGW